MALRADSAHPWPGALGLAFLGVVGLLADLKPAAAQQRTWRSVLVVSLLASLILPANVFLRNETEFNSMDSYWSQYCVTLAWLTAVGCLFAQRKPAARWRSALLLAALCSAVAWLGLSYLANQTLSFYLSTAAAVAVIILGELCLALPALAIQAANTALLILIFLPIADFVWCRTTGHGSVPEADVKLADQRWTYAAAKADPKGYSRWWSKMLGSTQVLCEKVIVTDTNGSSVRLRPGVQGMLGNCPVSINSKGFRGKEIADPKGDTFRIVALGESTTFGWTLQPGEKPWAEILEELIRERLHPARPVEVINAGIPRITLPQNLRRLPDEILPLKPDLLISYHGINGFPLLDKMIPSLSGKSQPVFQERPLRLLAECEYRLRLLLNRRAQRSGSAGAAVAVRDPLQTDYARAYRELIQIAETNHIPLVLANYSMAVNRHSLPELIEFYRPTWPAVYAFIDANEAHSQIVQQLAAQNPGLAFVDTHPHLDGESDKFYDLVHFTPEGDRQVAEAIFAAIRPTLEAALTRDGGYTP